MIQNQVSHSLVHRQCVLYFKTGWCFSCDFLHLTINNNRFSKLSEKHYHQLITLSYLDMEIITVKVRLSLLRAGWGCCSLCRLSGLTWIIWPLTDKKKQKTKILLLPLRATGFRPHRSIEAESSAAAVPHRQPADTSPHATLHWPDLQSTVCLHRSAMKTRLNLTDNKG